MQVLSGQSFDMFLSLSGNNVFLYNDEHVPYY